MKYFKIFNTEAEYLEYAASFDFLTPNVSTLRDCTHTWITAQQHRYIEDYFTVESLEDNNTITMTRYTGGGFMGVYTLSVSLDDGETWSSPIEISQDGEPYTLATLDAGEKALLKYDSGILTLDNVSCAVIGSDGEFNAYGNVMSLRSDNFPTDTSAKRYAGLFRDSKIVSVENLVLPSITMETFGYYEMFKGCTHLTDTPKLIATTLAESCYRDMFSGCTSLTTIPSNYLSATTVANECYRGMFSDCTSLATTLTLPSTTMATDCYRSMFCRCTSLTTAPTLPATTLANGCYFGMLENCTSLTTAPELPSATMVANCYHSMFKGCTSLTLAPTLSASSLANGCYKDMFSGCTSLTTASHLPATTLYKECYMEMFKECSALTTVIDISAANISQNACDSMFNSCTSLPSMPQIAATSVDSYGCCNMFKNCTSITSATELHFSSIGDDGCLQMFQGCTSLVTPPSTISASTVGNDGCRYMFLDCTSLTTAPSISATTLGSNALVSMFAGCSSLTTTPSQLPATTLANSCYKEMFKNCTSLTTIPTNMLPATTLANNCYQGMFQNCIYIAAIPSQLLPATTLAEGCYRSMFQNCSSALTTVSTDMLPATTVVKDCYRSMFFDCRSLEDSPTLPAETLAEGCYMYMFNNCFKLDDITCYATDISASACTNEWVYKVKGSGVFTKRSTMSNWTTGVNGIPSGWTIHDDTYVAVTGVTLNTGSITVNKGNTYTLTATVLPANASTQTVTWSTSDSSVATVANGVVTGASCGNATITVTTTDGSFTAQCAVAVENHVTSVDLNTYILTLNSGGTYQLVETITPSDACNTSVTWSSSNSNIASVNSTGLVSGVTTGSATVTVTTVDGGYSKNCSITVNDETIPVTGVTLTENSITINTGDTHILTANVLPSDATNKNVTWSSNDNNIATVDSNGVVSGIASGSTIITVTTTDGGYTAQCSVNVTSTYGYFTIRSLANSNTFTIANRTAYARYFSYSLDSGSTWTDFTLSNGSTQTIATIDSGETIMMKGNQNRLATAYNTGCVFRGSQDYEIEGNISSLLNNNDTDVELQSQSFHFAQLFSGDTHLISAENLKILATTLYTSSFNSTFRGCTNLQKAPDLSVPTILGQESYSSMFEGCTSLSQPPSVLSATTAQLSSYKRMFCMSRNSSVSTPMTKSPLLLFDFGSETNISDYQLFCGNGSLTEVKCFWTNTSGSFGGLTNWMNNVSSSGTFYKRSTQSFQSGTGGIPTGWTVINDDVTGN